MRAKACEAPSVAGAALARWCSARCGGRGGDGSGLPAPAQAADAVRLLRAALCQPEARRGLRPQGPGRRLPALWIYHARGLPVQVVAETTDWRRICDPDGGAAWVHRAMIDGRRTVMRTRPDPLPSCAAARATAPPASPIWPPRALAALDRCQGDWCKVKVGGASRLGRRRPRSGARPRRRNAVEPAERACDRRATSPAHGRA